MSKPPTDGPVRNLGDDESSPNRALLRTEVARALTSEGGFGSVKVLSREAAERVFTTKRQEILRVLDNHDVSSQRELAGMVNRDPGAVQRDLTELAEADLVTFTDSGRSKKPALVHDTIIIEPLVAPADIVPDVSYTVENEP